MGDERLYYPHTPDEETAENVLNASPSSWSTTDEASNSMLKDKSERPVGIVLLILSVTAFYIFASQIAFCILKCSDNRTEKMTFNLLCAMSSLFTFCRVAVPHLKHELICGFLHDFEFIAYSLAYLFIWTTLWLRQYYFYQAPTLRGLYSCWLRILSFALEFLIVVCFIVTMTEYFLTRYYDSENCLHDGFEENEYAWIATFSVYVLLQVILVGFLIYPLYKHRTSVQDVGASRSPSSIQLNRIIFRTAVASGVCIVLVLLSLPVRFLLDPGFVALFLLIYNLNLVAQLIAVIVSFKSWKCRLFPWKALCARNGRREGQITNTSRSVLSRTATRESRGVVPQNVLIHSQVPGVRNFLEVKTVSNGSSLN